MVMVLKSNVSGTSIVRPDGWNPPFTVNGLKYANIFGRGNLTANLAPGGASAIAHGNPTQKGEAFEFSTSNYLDTRVPTSEKATLIAIANNTESTATARCFFISSFNGSTDAGKSLVMQGAAPPALYMYSHYKGTDANGNPFNNAYSVGMNTRSTDRSPAFFHGRDKGNGLTIGDLTNDQVKSLTPGLPIVSFANPARTYLIGQSNVEGSPKHLNYASLIYDRALSDEELMEVYMYFKGYYGRRGMAI
ncbi:hypothetical protein B7L73_12500 [Serratia marcescens]|uniref:hypothetical protein n=1 Tax=Serratia marcescens TaxID=615 RepID=UPI000A170405|nr:hypothetical protein [Serratia marcescens]OSB74538.1 hypothetical protein B7R53_12280 [Serratia marcescens]OSB79306.1 hypothetical protein B7R52_02660 [Serratia marcescens]OSB82679.1 hypothetical protein B7L73_12500 [Serratia marcescens]HEJ9095883.1 hypothetical protein [Serratia odorifera]